jgi:large subunit ribosomal protein L22
MEAIANGTSLKISTKQSVEICRLLRNKSTEKAKAILERVIEKKQAVPYLRYKKEIPHRKGEMMTGRYPIKASQEILKMIKNAESNATNKGMSSNLIISHISAHKGASTPRYGRKVGREGKNTHIKITVSEKK